MLEQVGNKDIHVIFYMATKYFYDPKYGVPESYDKMSSEHREQLEHMVVNMVMSGDDGKRWDVVARIVEWEETFFKRMKSMWKFYDNIFETIHQVY